MNIRRRFFSVLLITALAFAAAFAQQTSSSQPSVDRIHQVIEYLASDALEGRRTGTPGANDAAHYIAGEFNRYGLRPGMQMARPARTRGENQARYLQPFPYIAGVELGKNTFIAVNPGKADDIAQFIVGEDWMPLGFSSNGDLKSSAAVFVGYGITDAALQYNDYPAVTSGKIALAISGTPDGDNPHGKFARYQEVRWKAIAAKNAGARGILIISSEAGLKDDPLSRLHFDNSGGEAGIPVIVVSRKMAIRLLGGNDVAKITELETAYGKVLAQQLAKENAAYGLAAMPDSNIVPVAQLSFNISVNVIRRQAPSFNVVGILSGSDPKLKDEAIVIGAHYDHLGRGGEGSLAPREGEIHHGADDNASGVAGLIELARRLSTQNPKPRRTIVFIAFSGEEEGLIGSSYYVKHPVVPLSNSVAMINMDMIGRLKDNKIIIGGVGTAQELRTWIENANTFGGLASLPVQGFNRKSVNETLGETTGFSLTLNEDGYGPSDHSSFYAKQVPVLFFWTGNHEDYHKPSDTADRINYVGEARVVSFIAKVIGGLDRFDKRPTYTVAKSDSQGRSTGFRVYLGTIPNYADSNDGLKLDGVRDDSPASKAGLKADDKIVKMAGREVKNVYDYTYALGEMKAGQEYEVEIVRGSERLTLKITPAARK